MRLLIAEDEHDLPGAKSVAKDMLDVLKDWNEEKMQYAD